MVLLKTQYTMPFTTELLMATCVCYDLLLSSHLIPLIPSLSTKQLAWPQMMIQNWYNNTVYLLRTYNSTTMAGFVATQMEH